MSNITPLCICQNLRTLIQMRVRKGAEGGLIHIHTNEGA